jgi:hypothetical protein
MIRFPNIPGVVFFPLGKLEEPEEEVPALYGPIEAEMAEEHDMDDWDIPAYVED